MADEKLDVSATSILLDDAAASDNSADVILEACLDILAERLDSERAFIMLYDSNFEELNVFAAKNLDPNNILSTAEVSQTIINSVYEGAKPIVSTNASDDPRFSEKSSVVISGLRSVICVPIMIEEGLIGIIYMDNRLRIGAYQQKHLDFLNMCSKKMAQIILYLFPDTQPKPRKEEKK